MSEPVAETPQSYHLQLFVAGDEPNSRRARDNLARICRDHLEGRCELEVLDVLDDFREALANNILVAPTLVIREPGPRVTVVGDFSDEPHVLSALRLPGRGHD